MTHGYLFFLISAFLLVTHHWYESPTIFKSIMLGGLIGLISLIRPTEILVALIFAFWKVSSITELKQRINSWWTNKWQLGVILAMVILVWIPQFLFWKERTGSYFFFSYGDERFFWNDPQIVNILFSYRKGWITYSPLIALVFIGFFFMKGEAKKFRPVLAFMLMTNIYVLSCWWDWFFGGGFGGRAFSQHIAYLSLPLASLCNYFVTSENFSKALQFLRALFFAVVFSGISLSIGQTYQFVKLYIHYCAMTKDTYWLVWGRYTLDEEHMGRFWGTLKEPDNVKLKSGEDRDQ